MSTFPSVALVQRVQGLILEICEIAEQTAKDEAASLVALVKGWGDPKTAEQLDWTYLIKKRLSEAKYRWRSDVDREKFVEGVEKSKQESYESVI
jgi:hypothetical protein